MMMMTTVVPMSGAKAPARRDQVPNSLPQICGDEELDLHIEALSRACLSLGAALYKPEARPLEAATAALTEATASAGYAELRTLAIDGPAPATRGQIAQHLGVLVACYQHARPSETFVQMAVQDVGAMRPSLIALERACRTIRRTCKFPPTIAEILEALQEAEKTLALRLQTIREIPARLERASRELADHQEHQKRRREADERHARAPQSGEQS
jgi:hypothetical protein